MLQVAIGRHVPTTVATASRPSPVAYATMDGQVSQRFIPFFLRGILN
jgi:hypothetical protein